MATTKERTGPLLLLDGMSLAFRAYFALPDSLATTTGLVTNAVYGFSSMLVYLIREHRPSALAVAFDPPGDTFRDEMLEDYKAGRAETPALLPPQFDMIREVLGALAIPVVEVPGYEADDVIATLATEAAARDSEVVIVTGDRDSFQLIRDPYIRVLYNKRGVSDYALYDEAGIFERSGVPPSKYVLLAALRGDPSDNLPGVPGVGEKTAAKLLTSYGDLDGIFGHLDELTPKLRENLAANEHLARSNAEIIPLVTDVPLLVDVGELTLGGWNLEDAEDVFTRFEMKTVWQRLEELLEEGRLGEPAEGSARPGAGRACRARGRVSGSWGRHAGTDGAGVRAAGRRRAGDGGGGDQAAGRTRHGEARPGGPLDRGPGPQRAGRRSSSSPPKETKPGSVCWSRARCCRRRRWPRSSTPSCPARSSGTTSRRPCGRCSRWAST